jgi:hypothetical protein
LPEAAPKPPIRRAARPALVDRLALPCPPGDFDDSAVALAVSIASAEVDVDASVLPRTKDLVAVAEGEGVTSATFSHDDTRIIWQACDVARDRPLIEVLRLARSALQEAHHWDPQGPFGTGSRWSNETLAQLADSYPPCVAAVRANARSLLALARRWHAAEELLAQFRAVLAGDADPSEVVIPRDRPPTVTVTRRSAGGAA